MTRLSFTLSWIPHCCPQKQQCVLTSRSGSTYAFHPVAGIRLSVGPNCVTNSGIVIGGLAIYLSLVLREQLGGCLVRATCHPGPLPVTCAGRQDTHPDSVRHSQVRNECPKSAPHLLNPRRANATRRTRGIASRSLVPSERLPPYRIARRS